MLLLILVPIVLILATIKFTSVFLRYRERMRKWRKFPGPSGLPIIGHSLEFQSQEDILSNGLKYMKEYGLTFRMKIGHNHYLFTGDPRLNEIITTSHTMLTKSLAIKFMRNWLGDGLITSDNPIWSVHRRLITPTFHFQIIEDFVPIFNKNVHSLVQFFRKERMNGEFNIYDDLLLSSMDTICETSMGIKINALRDGQQSNYFTSAKYMGKMMMMRSFSYWKQYDFLFNMTGQRRKELKMINCMRSITDNVIKSRKAEVGNVKKEISAKNGRKRRVAFLDQLLLSMDENGGIMTNEELRQEVDTFIFAGHETVSSAVSFTLYYLAMHPEIQERAYEEVKQVMGSANELSYYQLGELKYLDCVIKETLRLCPSVPIHARVIKEDIPFDGKVIPKGSNVVIFVYGAHRNETLFPDPEKFDPDRFMDPGFAKRTLFGYLPFNAGPRNCIGRRYAMTSLKCVLSVLLKEFRFTKNPDFVIRPLSSGVLISTNGIRVTLHNR